MDIDFGSKIIDLYRARARNYDLTANFYYLIGYREWAHRRRAVGTLALNSGDIVVEVGCGTGLNFPLLQQAVGPRGKIVGVDLTDAMLERAQHRVRANGWQNVELVHADALQYAFPPDVDGILSTFALSLIPECGRVIRNGAKTLRPGGRWVVLDLMVPDRWPKWFVSAILSIVRPFGVSDEWVTHRPWKAILEAMNGCLSDVSLTKSYFGASYIVCGRRCEAGQTVLDRAPGR